MIRASCALFDTHQINSRADSHFFAHFLRTLLHFLRPIHLHHFIHSFCRDMPESTLRELVDRVFQDAATILVGDGEGENFQEIMKRLQKGVTRRFTKPIHYKVLGQSYSLKEDVKLVVT